MDANFEDQVNKVADVFKKGYSEDAAQALSQALTAMNHEQYKDFLSAVAEKAPRDACNWASLDLSQSNVHIWSKRDLSPDMVLVMPGQTLRQIAKNEDYQKNPSEERTKFEVSQWAKWNHIQDPNQIIAGKTLNIPQNL